MAKSHKHTEITVDTLMSTGIEALGEYIRDAREMLRANPGDSDRAATLANVLTKVATVQAEQRKSEAAQRKADEDMSPERMLERIRRMPAKDQAQLIRQMQTVVSDAGKSGLA